MTQAQLYLWSGARSHYIALQDFFVEQMKSRILTQFDDLEGQADRHTEEAFARMGNAHGYGYVDEADLAEAAYDEGIAHYQALKDMRAQMVLAGLAGMLHEWEKTVRQHLERELAHNFDAEKIEKKIWQAKVSEILDVFEQFGWPVKSLPFHEKLDALALIVNVYKHGKGPSLTALAANYGEFVVDPLKEWMPSGVSATLDYEWLTVTDAHFDEFAKAIRDFWEAMPERLFLHLSPPE